MQSAQHDEPRQHAGGHVAKEYRRANEIAEYIDRLAWELVHQVAGKRAHAQPTDRITTQYRPKHRRRAFISFLQIKRQYWYQYPEAEE
jgi:hypothetical protein